MTGLLRFLHIATLPLRQPAIKQRAVGHAYRLTVAPLDGRFVRSPHARRAKGASVAMTFRR